jgi:hypothetical protein
MKDAKFYPPHTLPRLPRRWGTIQTIRENRSPRSEVGFGDTDSMTISQG